MASVSGDFDLSNYEDRTYVRILGAIAQKESYDKSRRIRRKHQELAERGEVSGGGPRPFGYEEDRVTVREHEASAIREAASRILAGDSLKSVCRYLNDSGVRTSQGNIWKPGGLKRVLLSARISGQREHKGEIIGSAVWPGIIPPEQTARLRALLGSPTRGPARAPRRYLLAGLLQCHSCGQPLVARPRNDGERRYTCAKGPGLSGCGGTSIMARPTEEHITEAVLFRLESPNMLASLKGKDATEPRAGELQAELDATLEQADELAEAYAAKKLTMREWLVARKPIDARVRTLKKELSRYTKTAPISDYLGKPETLRTDWAGLDLSRQQAIIKIALDHVIVGQGRRGLNRFDPTRLKPVWSP